MLKNSIKKLFGFEPRSNINLDEGFGEASEKVSSEGNEMLEAEFLRKKSRRP
jgi:hypothetical protein